ncbi:MAG: DUF371 domain-containing protein [Thermoprotei archaeon]
MKAFNFKAKGHLMVRATHASTFEITSEDQLTEKGDCIIAVSSSMVPAEIPREIREAIRKGGRIRIRLSCDGIVDTVTGWGHQSLPLSSDRCFICRKSTYISPETLAIKCDKAARDLDRALVQKLREGKELEVSVQIETRWISCLTFLRGSL